jgi:ribosomal protein S18 acetylase RimI-like enzyme
MVNVRPYRQGDRAAVYDICIRTGHLGGDARGVFRDPGLLPEIFAGPYLAFEPELTFVVADDRDEAVGYILGTSDTGAFVRWFRDIWLPTVADRYPPPRTPVPGVEPTRDEFMLGLLHDPERMVVEQVLGYPAHLHIDILPGYQGAGMGRALVTAFVGALRAAGVPALHLCMSTDNHAARRFYDRVGFHVVDVPDAGGATYLGRMV